MSVQMTNSGTADDSQHPVASTPSRVAGRIRASTAVMLAGAGHGATFLSLTAGTLWLSLNGPEAMSVVRTIFVAGLYMQALPALGFALVARHLSRVSRPWATVGAAALSVASLLLMGVGTLQLIGVNGPQTAFLGAALVLMTAVGVGAFASRLAHAVKDGYESDPVFALEPEPNG